MDSVRRIKNGYIIFGARAYQRDGHMVHKIAQFQVRRDEVAIATTDKWLDIIYPCKETAVN